MTREEYLVVLKNALHTLPESDIADIASDFEEHFAVGISQGKTEHEISAELGDPNTVANTYFEEDLEYIGHTMQESAANPPKFSHTATGSSEITTSAVTPKSSGSANGNPVKGEKDLSGGRLFIVLFNLFVAWWVALTVYLTLLSFWIVSFSLLLSGIGAFTAIAASTGEWTTVLILTGIALVLLSVATGILNFFLSKWTMIGSKAYINWNKKIYNEGF